MSLVCFVDPSSVVGVPVATSDLGQDDRRFGRLALGEERRLVGAGQRGREGFARTTVTRRRSLDQKVGGGRVLVGRRSAPKPQE
jgi:hypothetical protein